MLLPYPTKLINVIKLSHHGCNHHQLRWRPGSLFSLIGVGISKTLSYDEALQQSIYGASGIDLNGAISLVAENPVVIDGVLSTALAVPVVISQLVGKGKAWGNGE
ncbi:S-adenosyl-L-methionine-dependentmethyltransferases superfamily protein [Striga asiatica]|uniref:S-adenosyl-L-methionine-dependentmethyltransferases superfamily protein n=1 Tax=Striga asiatica TaxID=4170 RepID=A0A5A7PEC2_STRAF|nr:S-adenosyl-L-methionine-dependentmethyltransferases superfamily protein [Striga asiatica]